MGTVLSVRLSVRAGLSLFIIVGPYLYLVVCVVYAYNLAIALSTALQDKDGRYNRLQNTKPMTAGSGTL